VGTDISCLELVELVTEFLEGRLDPQERLRIEKHLVLCEGCATYLEQMRRTVSLVGELREEHVSPEAFDSLVGLFRRWKQAS
jgi:anti-sigma factor RsiW